MSVRGRVLRIAVLALGTLLTTGSGVTGTAPTLSAETSQIYMIADNVIVRMNDMTGAGLTPMGSSGTWIDQYIWPAGIFVDAVGRIYVADPVNGRIVRMNDMTGAGWTTLRSCLDYPCTGANQFGRPSGIFVDRLGRIYVADGRIVRVNDMTGAGWTTRRCQQGPCGGVNIVVDAAGRIYVTDYVNSRIVRMNDMRGAGWTTLGKRGSGVNQFNSPSGIVVDMAGRIYVADSNNHRIVRMNDMGGAGWTTLGSRGNSVNQFNSPSGIFVDAAGRIYVADSGNHRVVRVNDMTGAGWTTLSECHQYSCTASNLFRRPSGIFVDKLGRIYVADGHIVRVNDMTGAGWTALGTCLRPFECPGVKQFSAAGIFVDAMRRIYLADSHGRIIRISGADSTSFGTNGFGIHQFSHPSGIFVDAAGRIYVADSDNHRVVRINDITGSGWTTLGSRGSGFNQFNSPSGIFVDAEDRIYVADSGNRRIVRMNDMTGAGWTTLGTCAQIPCIGVNQFAFPVGIFVGGAGRIYVVDPGNVRIVRVNDMTGAGWMTLGTCQQHPCSGVHQFSSPTGVFVDGAGRIYVADRKSMFEGRIVRVNNMTGAGWTAFDIARPPRGIFVR